jgi:hypothetical protein
MNVVDGFSNGLSLVNDVSLAAGFVVQRESA